MTVPEACAYLRIKKTALYAQINSHRLKKVKVGRVTRITAGSVFALTGEEPGARMVSWN